MVESHHAGLADPAAAAGDIADIRSLETAPQNLPFIHQAGVRMASDRTWPAAANGFWIGQGQCAR